jgi:NAD-dependent deacetylase
MDEQIASLAAEIAAADTVVAMTGAGVSTASGLPSFRGEDGIWSEFDQRDFHFRRFEADPAGFWTDRVRLRERFYGDRTIEPNAAHEALATLEARGHLDAVLTQNIDGLHAAAGSESVVELHGTNQDVECVDCGARRPAEPAFERARAGDVPPTCDARGGVPKSAAAPLSPTYTFELTRPSLTSYPASLLPK